MKNIKKLIFFYLTCVLVENNKTEIQDHYRNERKINPKMLQILAELMSEALKQSTVKFGEEWLRAANEFECAIAIRYREKLRLSALNMNFKSVRENNWNYEQITDSDSFDNTKERVDGGKLRLIQNYPIGKFCVEGITYSCGSSLNDRNSERSIVLNVETIRKAWFRQGNRRFLEVNWAKNCIWFSNRDFTSVRAIDIYPEAFTNCDNADEECIQRYIEVF